MSVGGCLSLERRQIYKNHLPLQEATAVIELKRCNYLCKEDIAQEEEEERGVCVCVCVCMCVCASVFVSVCVFDVSMVGEGGL